MPSNLESKSVDLVEQESSVDTVLTQFYESRKKAKLSIHDALKNYFLEQFWSKKKKHELYDNFTQQEILDLCEFILWPDRENNKELFEPVLYEYMIRWAFGNTYLDICKVRDYLIKNNLEERAAFLQQSLNNVSNLFWKRVTTITFTQGSDNVTLTNGYGSTTIHKNELLGKQAE